ncbi:MAG: hypothetical protein IPI60_10425 [Saprospiraceae bacterium]|nr:hypothetical protein [Saprospiraceae bacterium]
MIEPESTPEEKAGRSSLMIDSLVHYLPLGYLYLLILGIASDSLYYGILGINVISYSNVLDVLLSPVAHLTSGILFPLVILSIFIFGYFYIMLLRYIQQKKKKTRKKPGYIESLPFSKQWLLFTAFSIFCAFLGFGVGGGYARKDQLENQKLKIKHRLTFQNNDIKDVAIIGSNSSFIFYAIQNDTNLKITPIQNVLIIENIKE